MIRHLSEKEFLVLKIADFSTIPYSVRLECPNGCSDVLGITGEESQLVGWCETPNGKMWVCECPVCFERFRFHGTHNEDRFQEDIELRLFVQEQRLK